MKKGWMLALLVAAGCGTQVGSDANWPALTTPSWAHQPRFAVTNNLSDTLSFVTAQSPGPQLLANLPVGDVPVELEGPHHIAASPDGKFLYVNLSNYVPGTGSGPHGSHGTGSVPGSLLKLDARTGAKVGEVIVDRSPGDIILSADGKTAYVTHYDLLRLQGQLTAGGPPESGYSALAVVDTDSMTRLALLPICPTAHGEGLSADGRTLFATCSLSDELAVVDVSDRSHPALELKLPVGPGPGGVGQPNYAPYALTVSPKDGTVWISDNKSGDVRVFDPATMKMDAARTVFVGGIAMFGAFSKDGATYYVPHQGDDRLSAIDTTTLGITLVPLPPEMCLNAHAFVTDADVSSGVVVCEGDHQKRAGSVVRISLRPLVVTGFVETGMFSDGAAYLSAAP